MKSTRALAHVRQLCNLGLSSEAVMPALLESVRQLVRAESAGFFWVDARGEMSNLYAERMLAPEVMRRYFERHYSSPEHAFKERLKERAAKGEFVFESVADSALEATRYFQEVLSPLDAFRFLHAIVHERGRILGQLSLYRNRRGARFSRADKDVIEQVTQHIRFCCASNQKPRGEKTDAFRDSDEEALVIASTEGEIATASHRAYALLAHASGEPINRDTMAGAVDRASRDLLKRLAARLQSRDGLQDAPGALIVENTWGRYRLRADLLSQFEMGALIHR